MSEFIELTEKYKKKCIEYCEFNEYEIPSNHIVNIMVSIMLTRDKILSGGGFVKSIVENDLYGALSRGDNECIDNLKLLVNINHNCYLDEFQISQ